MSFVDLLNAELDGLEAHIRLELRMESNEAFYGAPMGPWLCEVRRPILSGFSFLDPHHVPRFEEYDPMADGWFER